jgi:hypothetical protein
MKGMRRARASFPAGQLSANDPNNVSGERRQEVDLTANKTTLDLARASAVSPNICPMYDRRAGAEAVFF